MDLVEDDFPLMPAFLNQLGLALRRRFEAFHDVNDLVGAVDKTRHALATAPQADPDRAMFLANLGMLLGMRFGLVGDLADAEDGIAAGVAAVHATPSGDPALAVRLSHVATTLDARFERTGKDADLDQAIQFATRAVAIADADADDEFLATLQHLLGNVHRSRGTRRGSLDDLDRAVTAARSAVTLTPPGLPDRPIYRYGLANALAARFDQTSHRADIDEAIEIGEELTAGPFPSPSDRALFLNGLSNAYAGRGERFGMLADLTRAVECGREVVEALGGRPANPLRLMYLSNLANKVATLGHHNGDSTRLDEAVALAEEAATVAAEHALYGPIQNNLAGLLRERFHRAGHVADLHGAIGAYRRALQKVRDDDPRRPGILAGLGVSLLNLFEKVGDRAHPERSPDLAEGRTVLERAVKDTPEREPDRARRLFDLASLLSLLPDQAALERALAVLTEATGQPTATPLMRAETGKLLAVLATRAADRRPQGLRASLAPKAGHRRYHELAAQAWRGVFEQVPLLVDRTLDRVDRQRHLKVLGGIGSAAAATALHLGDVDQAWLWLEQGRAVLLSQELESRTDLDMLRGVNPGLAEKVERIRQSLHAEGHPWEITIAVSERLEARRAALEEWPSVLAEIRQLKGFERFGMPPTMEELRGSIEHSGGAGGGAVVALNVSETRCDALVMTPAGPTHMPLPDLRADEAMSQAGTFRTLLDTPMVEAADANAAMAEVLDWLWTAVAQPVLKRLGFTSTLTPHAEGPRVWWIPTGPLSALPVHAAGRSHGADEAAQTALDRVVSSYTPTVRMLRGVRPTSDATAVTGQAGKTLVVGINSVPLHPPLLKAEEEARLVGKCLHAEPVLGADATHDTVYSGLPACAWAHFACHAKADSADPGASYLRLADKQLLVREIMGLVVPSGHLAYLSACSTAYGGSELLDEAIHLASAFQVAGFRHVVATQWPVNDSVALGYSEKVYDQVTRRVAPAVAVHRAVREVRRAKPDQPLAWASHVHFGR
ncbi:MAG TPA: CHAT domain-containing protein [Micromonosporaceae bacterium]